MSKPKKPQPQAKKKVQPNSPPGNKWTVPVLIFFSAFLLYANTLNHGYTLDDDIYTQKNAYVQQGFSAFKDIWNKGSLVGFNGSNDSNYRPLVLLNFMIEVHFFGLNPHVNHFFNVALFALSCVLIYFLFRKMFPKLHYAIPIIMALLFAFHPVHVEDVANVKSRDEILGLLFGIMSFFHILEYAESWKMKHYWISLITFFASVLCKENGLTFVLIIPLLLYFFSNTDLKKIARITAPYLGLIFFYIIIRNSVLDSMTFKEDLPVMNNALMAAKTEVARIPTKFVMLGKYLTMLFVPYPLSWDYSFNQIPIVSFSNWKALLSMAVYIGMGVFVLKTFKEKNVFAFAILLYLITIFLSSNLVVYIGATFAERFLYTPSLGFCIAFPLLLVKILKINPEERTMEKKNVLYGITAVVLLVFAVILVPRNKVWENNFTLFSSGVLTSPNSARAQGALASELRTQGENSQDPAKKMELFKQALVYYSKASEIYAEDGDNWYNQGVTYYQMGDMATALKMYEKTLEINPKYTKAMNNAGVIYFNQKDYDKGITYFKKVLEMDPNYVEAMINLGAAYQNKGDNLNAIEAYKKGIAMSPNNPNIMKNMSNIYNSIGVNYFNQKDWTNAMNNFNEVLKYDPNSTNAITNIGCVYQNTGNNEKAMEYYLKGLTLDPKNAVAHRNISQIYSLQGNMERANYHAQQAANLTAPQ